jgi:hypothetical protein
MTMAIRPAGGRFPAKWLPAFGFPLALIGIVVPVLGGLFVRRYATAHFDRLAGRPWREDPVEAIDVAAKPAQAGLA